MIGVGNWGSGVWMIGSGDGGKGGGYCTVIGNDWEMWCSCSYTERWND